MRAVWLVVLMASAVPARGKPAVDERAAYRYGGAQNRLLAAGPHGVTHYISPDFELHDGLAVLYVRVGRRRVARIVNERFAARVYGDQAPVEHSDGRITTGDAWISFRAPGSRTTIDRLLLSSARRVLFEVVPRLAYLSSDHLGSVTAETDEHGELVGRSSYGPFGDRRAASGDRDRYGFTGQERDASGLLHFAFRQLDPATGRWSSPDPLFAASSSKGLQALGQSSTPYTYVANNSTNHVDPTGLIFKIRETTAKRSAVRYRYQGFEKRVQGYLNEIQKTKDGKELLNELKASKQTIKIRPGLLNETPGSSSTTSNDAYPGSDGKPGKGADTTITLDERWSIKTMTGSKTDPFSVALLHELFHALDNARGTNQHHQNTVEGFPNNAEYETITREDQYRTQAGLSLRKTNEVTVTMTTLLDFPIRETITPPTSDYEND